MCEGGKNELSVQRINLLSTVHLSKGPQRVNGSGRSEIDMPLPDFEGEELDI